MHTLSRSAKLRVSDAVVAAITLCALATLTLTVPGGPRTAGWTAVALGLAVVQAGAVLRARCHPERALAVATAAGVGIEILSPHVGWLGMVGVPLTYLAATRPPRISLWGLAALVALTPWKLFTGDWRDLLLVIAGLGLAWTWGELIRASHVRRAAEARRIVTEERTRIARELHDVVAHNVSVILVQAAAAEDVFDARPERAREALGAVQHAARAAMAELRTLLHTMHAAEGDDPNAPQPGLEQLDTLAAALSAAGLKVALRREGAGVPLPASVDLSAYRIVQESLTNTLRHGRATRADVTVRYADSAVQLEVTDDGTAAHPGRAFSAGTRADGSADGAAAAGLDTNGLGGSGKHGIVGMRERARLLGGTLDAGPMPQGGFRVRAHLPLRAAS